MLLLLFFLVFIKNFYRSYFFNITPGKMRRATIFEELRLIVTTWTMVEYDLNQILFEKRPKILNFLYRYFLIDHLPRFLLTLMSLYILFTGYLYSGLFLCWVWSLCIFLNYISYTSKFIVSKPQLYQELYFENLKRNHEAAGFEYFKNSFIAQDGDGHFGSFGDNASSGLPNPKNPFGWRDLWGRFKVNGTRIGTHLSTHASAYSLLVGSFATASVFWFGYRADLRQQEAHNLEMKFKDKLGRDKNEISNIAVAQARATGKVDPGVAIIVAGSLSQSSSDSSTNISIDLNQSSNVPSKVIGKK